MYSLTVHFGPHAMCWQFLFKDFNRAKANYDIVDRIDSSNTLINIEDDFGQSASIRLDQIHGRMLEDLDLVEEAQIQRSLVNARAQAKLNSRAANDPALRAAQSLRGAPVLTPMGRN